jgi:hypothetical protein
LERKNSLRVESHPPSVEREAVGIRPTIWMRKTVEYKEIFGE